MPVELLAAILEGVTLLRLARRASGEAWWGVIKGEYWLLLDSGTRSDGVLGWGFWVLLAWICGLQAGLGSDTA